MKNVSLVCSAGLRRTLAVAGAVLLTCLLIEAQTRGTGPNANVIKFSHRLHVQDAGMGCLDCHEAASTSASARDNLMPKKANCESCHAEQLESSCTTCHFSDDPSDYRAFVGPDRDLLFGHELHVARQKMECITCHAGVEQAENDLSQHLPPMETCYTCHNDVAASNQCERCHLNLAGLRPLDHNRTDFTREHKRLVRSGQTSCAMCHSDASCEGCHAAVPLVRVDEARRDLISPRSPRLGAIDRGQTLGLQKVHDLNFRYTHGVAAAGKMSDCGSCHATQEFCAACHAAGGNITQSEFRPSNHTAAFVATEHGRMARRDIETCAACHDAAGAEPTCVFCHSDPDGVRGTNTSIHPAGFMRSTQGPWHSDPGANCYVCHTDPNARVGGLTNAGFCRYCHQ